MRYVDEFRDSRLIDKVARKIHRSADHSRAYNFMDVCGTHTMNIFRFGLRAVLPENINLISGPGCPVCVTANDFLDKAIAISRMPGVMIATFGDMFRVPGSYSSLEKEKARGAAIKTVYSTIDALDMARRYPSKEIVFLGVGFETTVPTVGASILKARKKGIKNYSVLCAHKTMPGALIAIVNDREVAVDGFLLPGHVSAIIGKAPYEFLSKTYKKMCVIAGFEPLDILESILMLISQKRPDVEIEYSRVISARGNAAARSVINKVFAPCDAEWRGIGMIKNSGLKIRNDFREFDAERKFRPKIGRVREDKNCLCGDVLKGVKKPTECKLFGRACTPEHAVGSCMVSSEGTCAAYYRYRAKDAGLRV